MANKMQAVVKYGPRIAPGASVHNDQAVAHMMDRSGASRGECFQSIQNFVDMLRYFLREGRNTHIDDLGSFSVEIDLSGQINIHFRAEQGLRDDVQTKFSGVIENGENVGKTLADLIALWNADPEHANDQIPTT